MPPLLIAVRQGLAPDALAGADQGRGALELLPQTLASMAIIPLQMKLVYRVGTVYGYALDRGHVKDLLATMGVGVTGQYLEDIGRRLLGGVLGRVGGRLLGGLAGGATGVAFSFATTWAIGQVARRYYAGGRTMSAETLRDSFASLMEEAKAVQTRYAPQIEAQARQIDVSRIVEIAPGMSPVAICLMNFGMSIATGQPSTQKGFLHSMQRCASAISSGVAAGGAA